MNPFRLTYRALSGAEIDHVAKVKELAGELHSVLSFYGTRTPDEKGMREMALARTRLEECVMWATKAIT